MNRAVSSRRTATPRKPTAGLQPLCATRRRPGRGSPPDYAGRVAAIAEGLGDLGGDPGDKLVWLLEHEYTQAGLSFDTLKNADAAAARALGQAAAGADCAIHAAIVQIRRWGGARVEDDYIDSWNVTDYDADDLEMDEEFDTDQWLDAWASQDGSRPAFERIPLLPGELLPRGALDGADPEEQRLREATGNEGVTLERTYRRAALVAWLPGQDAGRDDQRGCGTRRRLGDRRVRAPGRRVRRPRRAARLAADRHLARG
jgi:hypothetical protein